MAMNYIEHGLKGKGDADLAEIIAGVRRAYARRHPGEEDILLPQATQGVARTESQQGPKPQDALRQAIAEYKKGPVTPESVTSYWKAKWQIDAVKAGLAVAVPDCDWTKEELQRPMVDVKGNPVSSMMVYKPEQIRGREGLILLGKMYPRMESYSVRDDFPVTDEHDASGWIKVEATLDAPNLGTTQKDLENLAKLQGYHGQRLSTYILASQASKDLAGHYLDERTYSRLLGSRREGGLGGALLHSGGLLHVHWDRDPRRHDPGLGGRFEEVKRT